MNTSKISSSVSHFGRRGVKEYIVQGYLTVINIETLSTSGLVVNVLILT